MADESEVEQLRDALGRLVRQLTREDGADGESVTPRLQAHLGIDVVAELSVVTEELDDWELPNLQVALTAVAARPGWSVEVLGLSAYARHNDLGLGDLCHGVPWGSALGPPEYVNEPVGPGETLACLAFGVLLVGSPAGALAALVRRAHGPMGGMRLSVQAVSPVDGAAVAFVAELRELMRVHDVYRGHVLTVTTDPMRGSRLEFVERPHVDADELVLPEGLLETIERNVVGISRHRARLVAAGRHLSRGLLLWGPPGTGKTHTVRHLIGVRDDATVIIVSGGALAAAGGFVTMARRLAPSMLVLEDVDLVAEERTYGPFGSSPVLFDLMNHMDGLPGDADIAFVLTTNRADALEPALAARPGRIDLAVELPLPDDGCRRRLLALYGEGLELELHDAEAIVARTEGVTASFLKELLRAAALHAAEGGRQKVVDDDVTAVLDTLAGASAELTRVLLGGDRPRSAGGSDAHGWLAVSPSRVDPS